MPNSQLINNISLQIRHFGPKLVKYCFKLANLTKLIVFRTLKFDLTDRGTVASVVIQAIGSGTNEETLMKATHPMIRLDQFGACIKLI